MIYEIDEKKSIAPLFEGWQESMIYTCLQDHMGKAYANDLQLPDAAMIIVDVFCFFAGKVNEELIAHAAKCGNAGFLILTPQNDEWAKGIEHVYQEQAHKRQRYAIKKERDIFDEKKLQAYIDQLPSQYQLLIVDDKLYDEIIKEDWSKDLCSAFESKENYLENGLGVVALEDGKLVSGASSYIYYDDGIEIEIDTRREERRKGLALACGAKLILECLHRGWYPSWDAQNTGSVALAEKLGYHFDNAYDVYELYDQNIKKGSIQ